MKLEAKQWFTLAAIVVAILAGILSKFWHPIAAHVAYPFRVDHLVEELEQKIELLMDLQSELLCRDPNLLSQERILMKSVYALHEEEKNIKERLAECGALSYFRRYSIGKNVQAEIEKAHYLTGRLSWRRPAVNTLAVRFDCPALQYPLVGMKASYAKMLDFISEVESVMLGIWGMGGVGKTALMKWVRDSRSEYNDCFPLVLFIHAAKGFSTVADLQKAISSNLELAQIGNELSQSEAIRNYLQDKDFLLLVDDLWKYIDLEKVGIPSLQPDQVQDRRNRKVVFTTRSMDVCIRMGCSSEDSIRMKCLNKEDAWALFSGNAGEEIYSGHDPRRTIFNNSEIYEFAKEIVEECKGLPIALCTIGKLLSHELDRRGWRIARDLLKKSNLHEDLLKRLQESYDNQGMEASYAKVLDFICYSDNESVLLGVWGMGSVDRSALMKWVCDSRSDQYPTHFSVVLCVHCAKGFTTVADLQKAIASKLELAQIGNEISQSELIHDYLQDKDFLLLVDDLPEYLNLEKVGIPSLQPHQVQTHQLKRKVVFTTRSIDVCNRMGCSLEDTIEMKCLNEEDERALEKMVDAKGIDEHAEKKKEEKRMKDDVGDVIEDNDIAAQVDRLQSKIKARVGPVRDVQTEQLPSEFPGMEGSYAKVLDFLKHQSAQPILLGIWGMPGMGKTTLLRLVHDFYTDDTCIDCSFDHIMFVTAGSGCLVKNVQHAIAISLGLGKMPSNENARAMRISSYLEHRSFLLLLDDVRETFDWWDVGIRMSSHRWQKIIFATTSKYVCTLMGCRAPNTIQMQCLGNDDAWELFKGKVGHGIIDDDPEVELLARQMVSQCKGVPLALCSLGRAMSNKRNPREWRSTYAQLKDMSSEPSETNDKVATLQDTIRTAEQVQDKTKGNMSDSLRKRATQWPLQAARDADRYLL